MELKAPKRTEDQQTTVGIKRERSRCHEMEFILDFKPFFELILWEGGSFHYGMDGGTNLSHDLDLLLKRESSRSLSGKGDRDMLAWRMLSIRVRKTGSMTR